ncbi:MAG: hypothetical protein JXR96_18615, partial [Deltaproteobacteria bacterium]|nr:hypothetical protein [Deltaproteobacteria bacterium]
MRLRWILGLHIAALLCAGVVTWLAFSTKEAKSGKGEVIADIGLADLQGIEFQIKPVRRIEVERGEGDAFWITVHDEQPPTTKTRPDKGKEGDKAGAEPGNKAGDKPGDNPGGSPGGSPGGNPAGNPGGNPGSNPGDKAGEKTGDKAGD